MYQSSLDSLAQQLWGQDTDPTAYARVMACHEALHLLREKEAQGAGVAIAGCLTSGRRLLTAPCRELQQLQRMQLAELSFYHLGAARSGH